MTALETPFVIGQQMWMAIGQSEQVTKPCPVCNGDKAVTIILGTGEHVTVMCDGCGLGFEGPRGFIQEWEHHPRAVPFVIASVKSFRDDEWGLLSTDGAWASFSKLFQTEDEAREAAAIQAAAQRERNTPRALSQPCARQPSASLLGANPTTLVTLILFL